MTRKPPKQPPDDPEEYKRFLETAKQVEASNDPKALERAVKAVAEPKNRGGK
jgi:uncharacterized protein (DUF2267 family)